MGRGTNEQPAFVQVMPGVRSTLRARARTLTALIAPRTRRMASLRDVLPAPRHLGPCRTSSDSTSARPAVAAASPEIVRPELPVVVPARTPAASGVSAVLPLPVGADGTPDFAAVAKAGLGLPHARTRTGALGNIEEAADGTGAANGTVVVHASYSDLVEKSRGALDLRRPSREEEEKTALRTREALVPIVQGKVAAAQPKNFRGASDKRVIEYVRYTPASTNTSHNSGARQRIVKMVQAQVDPMEPPRFSQKKTPVNPPSPPAPVLHSPTRKPTKEELADWVIPPAISNWKNNRGYTVPLDKRLAADGAGKQDNRINDRFAALAETLYAAERTAREQVEKRAQIQRDVSLKAKEVKEKELRNLAARARRERAGFLNGGPDEGEGLIKRSRSDLAPGESPGDSSPEMSARPLADDPPPDGPSFESGGMPLSRDDVRRRQQPSRFSSISDDDARLSRRPAEDPDSEADEADARRRDALREERRRERDRELRMREAHGDESAVNLAKKTKLVRDRDRDISERVALGQGASLAGNATGEVMYDQRLFNQGGGSRGITAGFGAEDGDALYDKPLFGSNGGSSKFQYHPRSNGTGIDGEGAPGEAVRTSRFKAKKGLGGASEKTDGKALDAGPRSRPVEFERDEEADAEAAAELAKDPFGLNKFL